MRAEPFEVRKLETALGELRQAKRLVSGALVDAARGKMVNYAGVLYDVEGELFEAIVTVGAVLALLRPPATEPDAEATTGARPRLRVVK